jgi:hypothetical protein
VQDGRDPVNRALRDVELAGDLRELHRPRWATDRGGEAALTPAEVDLDPRGSPCCSSRELSESVVMHANIVLLPDHVETPTRMRSAILDRLGRLCDKGPS